MLALCLVLASVLTWLVLALGRGFFWRVVRRPAVQTDPVRWPAVVAIVPARDEADVLPQALPTLLTQDYPGPYRVVLIDDHSSDGSAAVARALGRAYPERLLDVIAAKDRPVGWSGKVWAQAEGVRSVAERGLDCEYLWFTDADIGHDPGVLSDQVRQAVGERTALTSLMVRLRTRSWAERAFIPAFVFFFAMLYPFAWVNNPRRKTAAAAGGSMLVRRDALEKAGGLASIRSALIDDCTLAALLKPHGPIRLELAYESRSLRPYPDWRSVWDMIARTAYTQLRYSPLLLLGTVLGMAVTYLVPVLFAVLPALLPGPSTPAGRGIAFVALGTWVLMAALYAPMLRYYRRSLLWAPLLPLIALFYIAATLGSAWRYYRGRGGQWKGRSQAVRPS